MIEQSPLAYASLEADSSNGRDLTEQMPSVAPVVDPEQPAATVLAPPPAPSPTAAAEAVAPEYAQLAGQILFAGPEDRFTLVVTSALSGEGVTTASVGVALALASSTSKRVLLVDANLRRPAVHEVFGLPQEPGLHEMVSESCALSLTPVSLPNLFVVPSGAPLDQPARLMTSEALTSCVQLLQGMFDYVVVDAPPLLTAVDAASICRLGTGIALVVRAGLTRREDARRAQQRLKGAPVMGVVLNRV